MPARTGSYSRHLFSFLSSTGNALIFKEASSSAVFRSDFTTRNTAIATHASNVSSVGTEVFRIGSEVFATSRPLKPTTDPETIPAFDGPILSMPGTSGSDAPEYFTPQSFTGFVHLNFDTGNIENGFGISYAGNAVSVGDHAYFVGQTETGYPTLFVTDGTSSGTRRVSSIFGQPMMGGTTLAYTATSSARDLATDRVTTGEISGSLRRADAPVPVTPSSGLFDTTFPKSDVNVFIDFNRNGRRDPKEPTTWTDVNGTFSFKGLKPTGKKRLRIVIAALPAGWEAIDGLTSSAKVGAGSVSRTLFRFRDSLRSAFTDGEVVTADGAGRPNARVWLDLDLDGAITVGEPSTTSDSHGHFHLEGLPAGIFRLRTNGGTFAGLGTNSAKVIADLGMSLRYG